MKIIFHAHLMHAQTSHSMAAVAIKNDKNRL
jgi:hypothetical protein